MDTQFQIKEGGRTKFLQLKRAQQHIIHTHTPTYSSPFCDEQVETTRADTLRCRVGQFSGIGIWRQTWDVTRMIAGVCLKQSFRNSGTPLLRLGTSLLVSSSMMGWAGLGVCVSICRTPSARAGRVAKGCFSTCPQGSRANCCGKKGVGD